MQSGSGRNPAGPPAGRSPASSAASPSSSSSAVSAQNHLGFESIQQQQQQLAYRQALQQQQLRKVEGEHSTGAHGGMGGGTLASSSGSIQMSQPPRKFGDLPGSSQQHREEHSSKGQGLGPIPQNSLTQAYLQFALQAAQQKSQGNQLMHQQGKLNVVGASGKDQDVHLNNLKMQELMSLQAANQSHGPIFKTTTEHFGHSEKQMDQGHINPDQRNDVKLPPSVGQLTSSSMVRSAQMLPSQANMPNITNNQLAMVQMQAMQAWAKEHNIDLSVPANMNLISQILPLWQFNKLAAMHKQNEVGTAMQQQQSGLPPSKQPVISPAVGNENASVANSASDYSGQTSVKIRQTIPHVSVPSVGDAAFVESNTLHFQQQSKEKNHDTVTRPPTTAGNSGQMMHLPQSSSSTNKNLEPSNARNAVNANEMAQVQCFRPPQSQNRPMLQPALPSTSSVAQLVPLHGDVQQQDQRIGFTKQQLYVLKAQILAFRRLKRGDRTLPPEVLQAIADPPIDCQPHQSFARPGTVHQGPTAINNPENQGKHAENNVQNHQLVSSVKGQNLPKEDSFVGEERTAMGPQVQGIAGASKEPVCMGSNDKLNFSSSSVKSEQELDRGNNEKSSKGDYSSERGKAIPVPDAAVDAGQGKKPPLSNSLTPKDGLTRKYHGPIYDFPSFTRKHDSLGSATANLTLAYDVKDLLFEEGKFVLNKKRDENLRKINRLLAVNLERKRIRPDLVIRLQIEERKLRLLDLQSRLRDEVDQQQQEIMAMADRPYRKFVRQCERQRVELLRQVQQLQKASREKQLKSIFHWRKKLLEAHWAIRDARTTRNRGVAKYHERMLREFSKRKDDDRNKRMEALKNNDVDRYREMLLEQQTNIPGDAAERYAVLSSFLSQTEEYLCKLGGKISASKNLQDVQEAANNAAAAARAQGLSEEEVKTAATCAREEVMIRNRFSEMNAPKDSSSANKYYSLAHAVTEKVVRQPSMLRTGTLRDYQLVGLQWMLSLYNNKLNGILADEMGLGKTVQVMALLAYLMEYKGNYGPHLIIVPNAVLVNWKSELLNWLPSVSCIFYVGAKEQRSKLFSQEVCAVKFNVLVTTYEFVMYDRSKLSKIDWRYIVIDEAQRMKDRESVLARDLDKYRCQRRLLLTGTPLQNDLKELWSLLNLLLPEVFDNRKAFHDWFSKPFQRDGPSHNPEEDDWLETEKKVIIIHRLHQILEPFMLRRRVEDVEGALPRKVSVVLRCRMSAIQSLIYDWIKSTGTIRVDPEDEARRLQKNPMYQIKMYKNLNNKCMELRKVCNHPLLNYPYFGECSKDFIVKSCGKLWVLDRILIKLHKSGHRVLLFSTMTKLLDILEEYLQWRRLVYRRIDGTTSLEDRESAIVDFNSPGSDCFIFLLSIRAAGRGLNLQTADTVVIYDPDPNPQNEEQAVARAHRIGQRREVKVIYMEAVVDKISSYQKEDELRNGGAVDSDDDLAGKDRYMGSIESLIRNNIQQYKIDMADEVINAGRFDQRTTHEERRLTLETLLHDDERYQETVHDVPSMQEVNRMIARSEEEVELFDQMDEDLDWASEMVKYHEVPKWLRASSREVDAVIASLSKKPSRNILSTNIHIEPNESSVSPNKSERRGRPRTKNYPIYRELDDEDIDDLDVLEQKNEYEEEDEEEEEEIRETEDEEFNGAVDVLPSNKDQLEEELLGDDGGYDYPLVNNRDVHAFDEAGSTGSSSGSRRLLQPSTPMSLQKFGSLSALDARPDLPAKQMLEELEEGEIAASGDSHMDQHQSGSWTHEHEEGEEEQVLQPKIKRKRSIRLRPKYAAEKVEERSTNCRIFSQHGQQPLQFNHEHDVKLRADRLEATGEASLGRHGKNGGLIKQKRNLPSRKNTSNFTQKSGRLSYMSGSVEDTNEHSRESWSGKATSSSGPNVVVPKMSDSTQRKCKNVISKLQKRIDKEGSQILPILSDWWSKNEYSGFPSPGGRGINVLDLQRIEQRVDSLDYNGVADFIADVQIMLRNIVRYFKNSYEIQNEASKLQDMFFGIMKIAFPDTDFRETRNAVTFSSLGGPPTIPSPKSASTSQNKRQISSHKAEVESGPNKTFSRGVTSADGEGKAANYTSRPRKESRPTAGTGREQARESSQMMAHPAELIICKKKRKDREKSVVKQRMAPISPSNPGRLSALSPSSQGILGPVPTPSMNRGVRTPFQRDSHSAHDSLRPLGWAHSEMQLSDGGGGGSSSIGDVQWAKPVKRTRTDTGKRRPSHS